MSTYLDMSVCPAVGRIRQKTVDKESSSVITWDQQKVPEAEQWTNKKVSID